MTVRRDPSRSLSLGGTWELRFPDDEVARRVRVPAPWEAALPNATGRGRPSGTYARTITAPAAWAGERIHLRCEAVMSIAVVLVDGIELGRHEGGFTPFEVELTGAVVPGREHRLEIVVTNPIAALTEYPATDAAQLDAVPSPVPGLPLAEVQHGKQTWYSSTSGIWKSLRLEARPRAFLTKVRVLPDLASERVALRWAVDGASSPAADVVRVSILGPDGRVVATHAGVAASAGAVELDLPGALPWSPESPALHVAVVRLESSGGDAEPDEVEVRFGMRDIGTADGRLMLNGRPFLMAGALDQYLHPAELVTFTPAEHRERMQRARELGLNLVRCHITVPDQAYLDAADELGMLLWCELPNWTRFSEAAGARGERALDEIVDALGNHPSLVIWTVINEDWGTRVQERAEDRAWVKRVAASLRRADPTRLVVDNSPCPADGAVNFHMETDLADFHAYRRMPDGLGSWEAFCDEFAARPDWLWSPHGDAAPRGDEPLVVSEFGNWGLPGPAAVDSQTRDPWWRTTTRDAASAAGWEERFASGPYARVWPSLGDLAEETQWLQFEALQAQIGAMRRRPAIAGWVITEFTDAFWEANGLLDVGGRPKAFHNRLAELHGRDALVARPRRWDAWADDRLPVELVLSTVDGRGGRARLSWLVTAGWLRTEGSVEVDLGPGGATVVSLPPLEIPLPDVGAASAAVLSFVLADEGGRVIAGTAHRIAVLPAAARTTTRPLVVGLDPSAAGLRPLVESLGHRIASPADPAIDVLLSGKLQGAAATAGETAQPPRLVVASSVETPADDPVRVLSRREAPAPDAWSGDWISAFAWIDADRFRVPASRILGFPYAELYPDHLLAVDAAGVTDAETLAGFFVGWLDLPGTVVLRDPVHGRVVTTFRLGHDGPLARLLLDDLLLEAAALVPAVSSTPAGVPASEIGVRT